MSVVLPTARKRPALDGEGLGVRHARVDGVYLGVEDDKIGVVDACILRRGEDPRAAGHAGDTQTHKVQKISTVGHPRNTLMQASMQ